MAGLILFLLLVAATITSCGGDKKIVSLTAAGLKEPFLEVVGLYRKKNPKWEVETVFAGSGSLLVKLENRLGDLYIPAAYSYMEEALRRGLIDPKTVRILAYHKPVIVVSKALAGKVKSVYDLTKAGIRLGIADPREAAIGRVTKRILQKAGLWERIRKNTVVRTPTVNQLLLYLKGGQINAAIIWKELAYKLPNAVIVEFPPNLVEVEPIPVGVTIFSKHPKEAYGFEEFLLRQRSIFKRFGFEVEERKKETD